MTPQTAHSSRAAGGSFLGFPLEGFSLFQSLLLSFAAAFFTFFASTFLAIFSLLVWNGIGGHSVNYADSYLLRRLSRWAARAPHRSALLRHIVAPGQVSGLSLPYARALHPARENSRGLAAQRGASPHLVRALGGRRHSLFSANSRSDPGRRSSVSPWPAPNRQPSPQEHRLQAGSRPAERR